MNKEQQKLKLQMFIFAVFIFVSFSLIIIKEKSSTLLIPKVEKRIDNYINEEFKEIKDSTNRSTIIYKTPKYIMKITNKSNKNHYFYIYYQNRKITNTYKEDYLEGKSILNYSTKAIQKDIDKITNSKDYKITINKKLNTFTNSIKNKIINEDNLSNLRIYNIEKEYKINKINKENIAKIIKEEITYLEKEKITPRTYKFIFTEKEEITNSLEISNITYKFINNVSYNEIIDDIINDNNSKLVKNAKIKYKYLN